jgi:outer membrane protein assembly factor BamB
MSLFFNDFKVPSLIFLMYISSTINSLAFEGRNFDHPIIGLWQTTFEDKGTEVIMILDIKSSDSDSLDCLINLPDFGFSNLPYGKFIMQDNTFTLPGFEASYNKNSQQITGTFSALGPELNIRLIKIDKKPEFDFECPEKEIDWSFKTNGAIWSSPTMCNDNVIFGNDAGELYSINITDKSISWIFKCDGPIKTKATIDHKSVYFSSDDGYLYSINLNTGKNLWKAYIGNNVAQRMVPAKDEYTYDYMCSSPVVNEGVIYIGSMDSCIYALNASEGSIRWKFKTGGRVRSTPILNDGYVYAGSWDHFLYALNASDGTVNWKYDAGGIIQSSPNIIDDKIVFGSRAAFIFALDKKTGAEIWKTRYWGSWVESSPEIYNGIIYIGSSDYRKLHALDPEDGEVIWSSRIAGWAWPTPAVSDKYVFTGSIGTLHYAENMHGRFYAIDRISGDHVWQVSLDDDADIYCYGFASSPTLYNGWIFFGGLNGIMYGVKE